ncbi:hypothetical protein LSH36_618g01069, partial [Paralvinella palmiformis]
DEDEEDEELMSSDRSELFSEDPFEDLGIHESFGDEQVHPVTPMSGREAVQYFTECYHLGKIKFLYFNIAPNIRYKPYHL